MGEHYQVFLSHASRDKPFVRLVAEQLRRDGITFFLDEAHLVPGTPWQVALERALRASDSCAVFIGDEGLGPYHTLEMRTALSEQAEANRGFRVIPVLLPGQTRPSERELPAFLKQLTWVEFTSDPSQDSRAYRRLTAGIEGREPGFVAHGHDESTAAKIEQLGGSQLLDGDTVLGRHADHWKGLVGSPAHVTGDRSPRSPYALLRRRLQDLRLDRYVWPGMAWEDPARTDEHGQPLRTPLPGQDREPARTVLATLLSGKNVVLYDDAGMGKTAFTLKLIELLIDSAADLPNLRGRLPLVMRLEGEWLRDSNGVPRTIAASLEDEIARSLSHQRGAADENSIASAVRDALKDGRVVILVDAFDQMTEDDCRHVANLLQGDAQVQTDRDDAALCAWLITGRPYALRKYQKELEAMGAKRLRLTGLSREQQDRYFQDYETDPFFQQRQSKPLDWVCMDRKEIQDDLAIPFHLREIRHLIELDLARPEGVRRISSTGELHGMVAGALLQRAVQQYAREAIPPGAHRPDDRGEQLELLLHVCGLLAFQMMLEERYNGSVDNHENAQEVRSFLERARQRFLSGEGRSRSQDPATSVHERWRWSVWMLEKIEFSHRGDIDSFNLQCRSFRDRKTMEWYAAHYLMNHATPADLHEQIPGAGDRCAADFAFDRDWGSNCWRQAIDMPRDLVQGGVAIQSLEILFQRPDPQHTDQTRPCELLWRAWERWLEPADRSQGAESSAARRPLPGAADLIARFREEFRSLCGAKNELALSLQFEAHRDGPDKKWGNKTRDGQYRLIPPKGSATTFQGERASPVTVSAFWLRKFAVTNAEYLLFDPHHESGRGKEFDQHDRPVVGVDWYAAVMFCRWLGAAYCLPTEAQWEAACRANETAQETEYWFGNNEKQLAKHAWYDENSKHRTHSLAESVKAGGHDNPWGLYDMHGNCGSGATIGPALTMQARRSAIRRARR